MVPLFAEDERLADDIPKGDADHPFLAVEIQVDRGQGWSGSTILYGAYASGRLVALLRQQALDLLAAEVCRHLDGEGDHGARCVPAGAREQCIGDAVRRVAPHRCTAATAEQPGGPGEGEVGVPGQQRVQNAVGNLIGHLVRMTFGHRLGSKKVTFYSHKMSP